MGLGLKTIEPLVFRDALNDEHPDVIFEAIKAASLNWAKLSDKCRSEILPLIEKALHKQPISIGCLPLSIILNWT